MPSTPPPQPKPAQEEEEKAVPSLTHYAFPDRSSPISPQQHDLNLNLLQALESPSQEAEDPQQKKTLQQQQLEGDLQGKLAGQKGSQVLRQTFFWLSGLAALLTWNAIMSLSSYWNERYKQDSADYFPCFFTIGGLLSFLVFDKMNKFLTFKLQFLGVPLVLLAYFVLLMLIGEYFPKQLETLKFIIFLLMNFVFGFTSVILQTATARYAFNFGVQEVSNYSSGTAMAGVSATLIGIVSILSVKEDDYFWQVMLYVMIVTVLILVITVISIKYFQDFAEEVERVRKTNSRVEEQEQIEECFDYGFNYEDDQDQDDDYFNDKKDQQNDVDQDCENGQEIQIDRQRISQIETEYDEDKFTTPQKVNKDRNKRLRKQSHPQKSLNVNLLNEYNQYHSSSSASNNLTNQDQLLQDPNHVILSTDVNDMLSQIPYDTPKSEQSLQKHKLQDPSQISITDTSDSKSNAPVPSLPQVQFTNASLNLQNLQNPLQTNKFISTHKNLNLNKNKNKIPKKSSLKLYTPKTLESPKKTLKSPLKLPKNTQHSSPFSSQNSLHTSHPSNLLNPLHPQTSALSHHKSTKTRYYSNYQEESFIRSTMKFILPSSATQQSPQSIDKSRVAKKIYGLMISVVMNYFVTLACFPSLSFKLGIGLEGPIKFSLITLIFNLGDLLGRWVYQYVQLKDNCCIPLYVVVRFGCIGLYGLALKEQGIFGEWYCSILYLVVLSVSTGHLNSGLFAIAMGRCSEKEKSAAGFLMVLSIMMGLSSGSFSSFLAVQMFL